MAFQPTMLRVLVRLQLIPAIGRRKSMNLVRAARS